MKLYFSPLSCSLASRITAYEAELALELIEIDPLTKQTLDGDDYRAIHALGLVPVLRLDSGEVLPENAAILQYLGDLRPEAGLAPAADAPGLARPRLHQWLCFVGTELHKSLYVPLLDKHADAAVKQYALAKAESRLGFVAAHLTGREFLLERFSVADAYLFTVLNWSQVTPIELSRWPALVAYVGRMRERASVKRALSEELPMYTRELARHAARAG